MRNAVFAALLMLAVTAQAQWINGQDADLVLGQQDFAGNTPGVAADSLAFPTGVAIDPTTGKLFVTDIGNDRVLRWPSVSSLASGAPAEAVFGQPDFTTSGSRTTRDGMDFPTDLVIDGEGRLYVADALNNRVLRFDSASWKSSGANADGVLGQPDFTSSTAAVTRTGMDYVRGLAVDPGGRLWVSDQGNNRVLRFDNAAAKPNGGEADGVLGQPDFTSRAGDTSEVGMAQPRGLWVDRDGRLWVAATFVNRVMRFDDAAAKPNGGGADAVLGQPDFVSSAAETSQTGMHRPSGITMDPSGGLYVGDFANNRVLWFHLAAGKPNGAPADAVLGQADFASAVAAASQSGLAVPWGVFFDAAGNALWVCDVNNNRVLRFTATLPLSAGQQLSVPPERFELDQNFPNPFNPTTTIRYTLPRAAFVTIRIYNLLGEELDALIGAEQPAGVFTTTWNAAGLPSGVYFYRLTAGEASQTKSMVLMR